MLLGRRPPQRCRTIDCDERRSLAPGRRGRPRGGLAQPPPVGAPHSGVAGGSCRGGDAAVSGAGGRRPARRSVSASVHTARRAACRSLGALAALASSTEVSCAAAAPRVNPLAAGLRRGFSAALATRRPGPLGGPPRRPGRRARTGHLVARGAGIHRPGVADSHRGRGQRCDRPGRVEEPRADRPRPTGRDPRAKIVESAAPDSGRGGVHDPDGQCVDALARAAGADRLHASGWGCGAGNAGGCTLGSFTGRGCRVRCCSIGFAAVGGAPGRGVGAATPAPAARSRRCRTARRIGHRCGRRERAGGRAFISTFATGASGPSGHANASGQHPVTGQRRVAPRHPSGSG